MTQTQQMPRFPSYHLDSILRSHQLNTVSDQPWIPPPVVLAIAQARKRLRVAVEQLDLPTPYSAIPHFTKSCTDTARAASTIETWLAYLPRKCVRSMVLDEWHWST